MKTENYNLIEEDWIPVLMKDGTFQRVSLNAVFSNGDSIADLSLNAYERVAVMRFLICIAMAALDEKDLANEPAWLRAKDKMCPAVTQYFKKWHNRFNFYGPHAFLQPDDLTVSKEEDFSSVSKIVFHCASGNNGTLFDHAAIDDARIFSDHERVIAMLAYLNFCAGGRSSKCKWDGLETDSSVSAGPAREKSMVHTLVIGKSLVESVWLGLLTGDMISSLPAHSRGRPVWEGESYKRKWLTSNGDRHSLLARLVPLSRVMKFQKGDHRLPLGEGLRFDSLPTAREPMATVRLRKGQKSEEYCYVSLSLEEAPWRNLHAILSVRENFGALNLRHITSCAMESISLWSGGLLTDGKAKDIAALEWHITLPGNFMEEFALSIYRSGLENAKEWADNQLRMAAKMYDEDMHIKWEEDFVYPRSKRLFWDVLEKCQPTLVRIATEESDLKEWAEIVKKTARRVFVEACPHQTARQMAAYVRAMGELRELIRRRARND